MRFSVGEIVEATGGILVRGDRETPVSAFHIDTRRLASGSAFVALPGTRTDGHEFIPHAARAGAVAAIVHRDVGDSPDLTPVVIRVDDTASALARCGAVARTKLKTTRVIGLTGSIGKTTTKELIAGGLSATRRVHRTPGNLNNHLGVPLTLLACPEDAEFAVVEMGMSGAGEIAMLTRMVRPDIGLVTNVCPAHLASFRTLDDIAAAKGELYAVLGRDATSVVNLDDAHVRVQSMRHGGPRVTFGKPVEADLRLEGIENRFDPGAALTVRVGDRRLRVQLRMGGGHSAFNALAALAVIHAAGHDLESVIEAMGRIEAGPGRGRVLRLERGVLLVDDSYNSNPAALSSVLETLRYADCSGRKVLVMGEMLELGSGETMYHRDAGKKAAVAGVRLLIGVGPRTRVTLESARRAGVPEVHFEPDAASAARFLGERLGDGDVIVVKGSRAVALDRLVDSLARRRERLND